MILYPVALPLLLVLLLLVIFIVVVELRILAYAYRKIGVRPRYIFAIMRREKRRAGAREERGELGRRGDRARIAL